MSLDSPVRLILGITFTSTISAPGLAVLIPVPFARARVWCLVLRVLLVIRKRGLILALGHIRARHAQEWEFSGRECQ